MKIIKTKLLLLLLLLTTLIKAQTPAITESQFFLNVIDPLHVGHLSWFHQYDFGTYYMSDIAVFDSTSFRVPSLDNTETNNNTNTRLIGLSSNGTFEPYEVNALPYKPSTYTPTLTISGNTLTAGGNSVTIPTGTTYTPGTGISISSNTIINSAPNPTITTAAYSSGTVYNITTTPAKLDFGTTDPAITLPTSGTYLIMSNVRIDYNGLTNILANTVNIKLRRTNNTASDLTNATGDFILPLVTLLTQTGGDCDVSSVIYTTSNSNDVIELWGNRTASVSVGNVQAGSAWIVAIKLF